MKTKLMTIFLLLALLFLPSGNVHAQEPGGDIFLLGQNYTLEGDETLDGSLAVIGGNADIKKDATVNGDIVLVGGSLRINGNANGNVALIGGNLNISGKIDGDIVVVGGQVLLTDTAVVDGDIATMGGQVTQEPGAQITGEIVNNASPFNPPNVPVIPNVPNVPGVPNIPNVPNTPSSNFGFNLLWKVVNVFLLASIVAAVSMLLTLFLQPQMERVGDTIIRQPLLAGSFGLLAFVAALIVTIVLSITLILIPVAVIVTSAVLMAWLFGVIAIGQEVGERFTNAINQTWAPVLSTGFGTFLFMLAGGAIGLIPCMGVLLQFVVGFIAIGGVAMTWFGTRSAPGTMIAQPVEIPPAS